MKKQKSNSQHLPSKAENSHRESPKKYIQNLPRENFQRAPLLIRILTKFFAPDSLVSSFPSLALLELFDFPDHLINLSLVDSLAFESLLLDDNSPLTSGKKKKKNYVF